MRYISILAGLALFIAPSCLAAQYNSNPPPPPPPQPASNYSGSRIYDHGEIGAFADYFRFSQVTPKINFVGVGGRVGFNTSPHVAWEAEMSYDFGRNFTSTTNNGISTSFARTNVRPLTGLFGPKFQFGSSGPFRAFLTGKVGFVNFSTSSTPISGTTFTGAVNSVGSSGTHLAVYPGGGIEFFGGPIGFRIDVGDEIYLNNGTFNNLKVSAGPVIRF